MWETQKRKLCRPTPTKTQIPNLPPSSILKVGFSSLNWMHFTNFWDDLSCVAVYNLHYTAFILFTYCFHCILVLQQSIYSLNPWLISFGKLHTSNLKNFAAYSLEVSTLPHHLCATKPIFQFSSLNSSTLSLGCVQLRFHCYHQQFIYST